MHLGGIKYIEELPSGSGPGGLGRPRVCRVGYESRGADFCAKNIDFPVSCLFVTEQLVLSHGDVENCPFSYTRERSFVEKQLKGVEARDAWHAFNCFTMKHHFSRSGGLGGRPAGASFSFAPAVVIQTLAPADSLPRPRARREISLDYDGAAGGARTVPATFPVKCCGRHVQTRVVTFRKWIFTFFPFPKMRTCFSYAFTLVLHGAAGRPLFLSPRVSLLPIQFQYPLFPSRQEKSGKRVGVRKILSYAP